jgi:hypothetical protein
MATSRTAKINAEIEKARAKIVEQQGKLRELEHKRTECENMEIVDIVRGLRIPLDQLAVMLSNIKGGTSGQAEGLLPPVPKSAPKNETEADTE